MRKYWSPLLTSITVALVGLIFTLAAGWRPELGLDLQGGASVIYQVPEGTEQPSDDQLDVAAEIIRDRVDSLGVAEPEIRVQGKTVVVELPGVKNQQEALDLVGQTGELRFRPVLSVFPGADTVAPTTTTVPGATTTTVAGATTTTVEGATTTTAAGATTTTAAGSTTTAASSDDTVDAGPGQAVPRRSATSAPPTTSATTGSATATAPGETTTEPGATTTTVAGATTTTVPAGSGTAAADVECGDTSTPAPEFTPTFDDNGLPSLTPREGDVPNATVVLPLYDGDEEINRYVLGPCAFTGNIVSNANAEIPSGEWVVSLELKSGADGIDLWNQLAAICYAGQATCPPQSSAVTSGNIGIVVDGRVISAPTVNIGQFERDGIVIEGQFTEGEAETLAKFLNYGALPVQLEPQAVQTVSATLGKDSLRAGLIAGGIGIGLVVLLMLAYYRLLGVVVLGGLLVSGSIVWTVIAWLGEHQGLAVTLAGATGIIVSVGVTVDSYVVYFERLKDDVRAGRSLRASAERGFKQAFRTILAADIVSLIGAFLLWYLTVGSVRGFAFFLGLSTVIDIFVAYFFTRPLVAILSRTKRFSGNKVLGVMTGEAKVAGGVA